MMIIIGDHSEQESPAPVSLSGWTLCRVECLHDMFAY